MKIFLSSYQIVINFLDWVFKSLFNVRWSWRKQHF